MRYVKMKEWRLIPYEKFSCIENMAIDEFLIKYYEKTQKPTLRLYGWSNISISVGKYQNVLNDINIEECTKDDVFIVRRITGGGAIVHNEELTYSLVCSDSDIDCKNLSVKETYEKLNSFLLNFYNSLGIKARFAKDCSKRKKFSNQPGHFCFSTNEEYDILVRGKKIGGNAQCRKKNIIFQHGSIPVQNSNEKIKKFFNNKVNFNNFTSLYDILKKKMEFEFLIKNFIDVFKTTFKIKINEEKLNQREREIVDKLILNKYSSDTWNIKGINNNE
ncbi:MAG: lipoate--protein ligase family protein [Candidatus Goldbacteria bacterium]|nr:lipoate--protein ligase family protein [Candidatus Goldiibacteriota bacterium]